MNEVILKGLIERNYGLTIKSVEKVKNTYKVNAEEGRYCIKLIKYQFSHFYFILSAMIYLQKRGFKNIPEIIRNCDGEYYITLGNMYAYLTKWIDSRQSDFDNEDDIKIAAAELADLHKCSEGFSLTKDMKPRIGWFTWIDVFETRRNEILDFKNRISQKAYKSTFDKLYLKVMDEEIERAQRSINRLRKLDYLKVMEKEVYKRGFCHHDYANHNILLKDNGDVYVIDFDYCIMDSHIHDLASFIIRTQKNGKWSAEKTEKIINTYSEIKNVSEEEKSLMGEFIRFPQMYWQVGIQAYWEQQPWDEEFFINRLSKYVKDRENRERFINEFFV